MARSWRPGPHPGGRKTPSRPSRRRSRASWRSRRSRRHPLEHSDMRAARRPAPVRLTTCSSDEHQPTCAGGHAFPRRGRAQATVTSSVHEMADPRPTMSQIAIEPVARATSADDPTAQWAPVLTPTLLSPSCSWRSCAVSSSHGAPPLTLWQCAEPPRWASHSSSHSPCR